MCNSQNIYRSSRLGKGLTQEQTAERTHVSVSTIRAIESGRRTPDEDLVLQFAKVFEDVTLGVKHLTKTSPIFRSLFPEFQTRDFPQAFLYFQSSLMTLNEETPNMIKLARDGKITEEEKAAWDQVQERLRDSTMAQIGLMIV